MCEMLLIEEKILQIDSSSSATDGAGSLIVEIMRRKVDVKKFRGTTGNREGWEELYHTSRAVR